MDNSSFDIVCAIFAVGIVFLLAGGGYWVSEKVRQMKLFNDRKDIENRAKTNDLGISLPTDD